MARAFDSSNTGNLRKKAKLTKMSKTIGTLSVEKFQVTGQFCWIFNKLNPDDPLDSYTSPIFDVAECKGPKWRLRLCTKPSSQTYVRPDGILVNNSACVSLYLECLALIKPLEVEFFFTRCCLRYPDFSSGQIKREFNSENLSHGFEALEPNTAYFYCNGENIITITCIMKINFKSNENCSKTLFECCETFRNIKTLFKNDLHSDIAFEVEGRIIPAHKNILAIRSHYFQAEFSHDFSETRDNKILVTDFSYEVIEDLLQYIYCGNVSKYSIDLLSAADKYNLIDLKDECEKYLMKDINVNNAVEMFLRAEQHQTAMLKDQVINYIFHNRDEVFETSSFKEMKVSNPSLLVELMEALLRFH